MADNSNEQSELARYRFFLKDTIRQQVDFTQTRQYRGLAPPPLQKEAPPNTVIIDLPDGSGALARLAGMSVGEAIRQRRSIREYGTDKLTLEELGGLLWATQGVREKAGLSGALRTVPSAGARHAFETYIAVLRVDNLEPGLYRYLPFDSCLVKLTGDRQIGRKAAVACRGQMFVAEAAVVFFWTAIPERMEWRYGLAAHKVIAVDAGHVGQNLYLATTAIGGGTCAIAAYNQELCDRLLAVDGDEEFTVYIAAVGKLA